jgi:hypothetical protein
MVPVLMQAVALMGAPAACGGDDGGGTGSQTSDTFPTAGPCFHDPSSPGCESTGVATTEDSTTDSGTSTTTDTFPTAGPCFHDPQAPECATSGETTTSTGGETDTETETDTDTDTDADTDTGSTGSTGS